MHEELPVLLVIFNRPEKTKILIEALRQIRPKYLFVTADGPRLDFPEDNEKCHQAREIINAIDWECELKTRFLDNNLGCGRAVSSGISWFFEHVDQGIILEDDCIPHPHFFPFCEELLKRYADDKRIMRISGFSPYPARTYQYDYHFSHRFFCSGWATWRRAWKHFSYDLDSIDETVFLEVLRHYYPFSFTRRTWIRNFQLVKAGILTTWAFRWDVACFFQNGLGIVPEKNFITNIGFDEEGTHTKCDNSIFANLSGHPITFPLRHPPFVYPDKEPERSLERIIHRSLPLKSRCVQQLRHFSGIIRDYFYTLP